MQDTVKPFSDNVEQLHRLREPCASKACVSSSPQAQTTSVHEPHRAEWSCGRASSFNSPGKQRSQHECVRNQKCLVIRQAHPTSSSSMNMASSLNPIHLHIQWGFVIHRAGSQRSPHKSHFTCCIRGIKTFQNGGSGRIVASPLTAWPQLNANHLGPGSQRGELHGCGNSEPPANLFSRTRRKAAVTSHKMCPWESLLPFPGGFWIHFPQLVSTILMTGKYVTEGRWVTALLSIPVQL